MELSNASAQSLGHLGLVASTLQEFGVMEKINTQLGQTGTEKVSYGCRVAAMVLNGLGFSNTALYMTPKFFHDKPLSLLLGEDVLPEFLNDDSLGRCLDKISEYGVTNWYSEIAFKILKEAGMLSRTGHLDSTTLSLYGAYENETNDVLNPCRGYSKDHRPDLKQVTLQCVTLGKKSLPIWMEALDGNSSDKKSFPETVKRVNAFYDALESAPKMRFIADSALYGPGLDDLNVDWITRVPETYKEAKELISSKKINWNLTDDTRYSILGYRPKKANERWLLVRSTPAEIRERKTFFRKHTHQYAWLEKALWHCSCQIFNCEKDAEKAVKKIIRAKKHFYLVDYQITSQAKYSEKGRPSKNATPERYEYIIEILGIASDFAAVQKHCSTLGRFILATNVTSVSELSDQDFLFDYKSQNSVERGFKFIKNDAIGLDNVYLKNPKRISALMGVMTLCLLIYGITEQRLHTALKTNHETLPDRKSKPTQTPTLTWIFMLFSSITVIKFPQGEELKRVILNLQPFHEKVLCLLGGSARKIYLIPPERVHEDIKLNQKNWLKWCGM